MNEHWRKLTFICVDVGVGWDWLHAIHSETKGTWADVTIMRGRLVRNSHFAVIMIDCVVVDSLHLLIPLLHRLLFSRCRHGSNHLLLSLSLPIPFHDRLCNSCYFPRDVSLGLLFSSPPSVSFSLGGLHSLSCGGRVEAVLGVRILPLWLRCRNAGRGTLGGVGSRQRPWRALWWRGWTPSESWHRPPCASSLCSRGGRLGGGLVLNALSLMILQDPNSSSHTPSSLLLLLHRLRGWRKKFGLYRIMD